MNYSKIITIQGWVYLNFQVLTGGGIAIHPHPSIHPSNWTDPSIHPNGSVGWHLGAIRYHTRLN